MIIKHCFAEFLDKAPQIKVNDQIVLQSGEDDAKYSKEHYSQNCFYGGGTRKDPYTYLIGGRVSQRYAIIDMWFCLMHGVSKKPKGVIIKVGDWCFELTPDGVTSEDGYHTKFLPL